MRLLLGINKQHLLGSLSRGVGWRSLGTGTAQGQKWGCLKGDTIRVGCSSGFWGDSSVSAPQLVQNGNIDYLVSDYLSEITMSLLAAAKRKNPAFGYTPDFIQSMRLVMKEAKARGIKVIANAGGVNLEACVEALRKTAQEQGVDISVAMVAGDDMMDRVNTVRELGVRDLDTGKELPDKVHSMNAYLGAFPIAEALDLGADIVVTGRCVDSALALAPFIHKFGWKRTDYDLLAAGSLAGHLIECGAQATGGVFTDWDKVDGWDDIGFPIVECDSDGEFVVTKPSNTGGLVSTATIAEQLVYEIGDPRSYMLPDVTCDFTNVTLSEVSQGEDCGVKVTGALGKKPSDDYKVSATCSDGYRAISVSPIIGPRAAEKSMKTADAILSRNRKLFKMLGWGDFDATNVHIIGSEKSYGEHRVQNLEPREVTMWIGVKHQKKEALELFTREIAPAGTGMAPGQTTLIGGRPTVSPLLRLFSFLYPKSALPVSINVDGEEKQQTVYTAPAADEIQKETSTSQETDSQLKTGSHEYRLEQLAYLRSGDKGDTSNIGVIARHPNYLPYIKQALTVEVVTDYFKQLLEEDSKVERFELPGIHALNFVLTKALGGGGIASIRIDPQGKGYAQMLADVKVSNLPSLEDF
ncbi:uncharacterized protein LOC135350047 [Halichondria panicea]|uniref:uncharacterized protein LOC135350047 n=1 Tax=Halichondria panicea TaxID=6063 RepID=UPI00312B8290